MKFILYTISLVMNIGLITSEITDLELSEPLIIEGGSVNITATVTDYSNFFYQIDWYFNDVLEFTFGCQSYGDIVYDDIGNNNRLTARANFTSPGIYTSTTSVLTVHSLTTSDDGMIIQVKHLNSTSHLIDTKSKMLRLTAAETTTNIETSSSMDTSAKPDSTVQPSSTIPSTSLPETTSKSATVITTTTQPTTTMSKPTTTTTTTKTTTTKAEVIDLDIIIIACSIGGFVLLLLVLFLVQFYRKNKRYKEKKKKHHSKYNVKEGTGGENRMKFVKHKNSLPNNNSSYQDNPTNNPLYGN